MKWLVFSNIVVNHLCYPSRSIPPIWYNKMEFFSAILSSNGNTCDSEHSWKKCNPDQNLHNHFRCFSQVAFDSSCTQLEKPLTGNKQSHQSEDKISSSSETGFSQPRKIAIRIKLIKQ